MANSNLGRKIAFVWIVLLLFASSGYAKMMPISEEDLNQVSAESGITMGLDVTARATAGSLGIWQTSAKNEGLSLTNLYITEKLNDIAYGSNEPFSVVTNLNLDVGTNGTRTWLNMSGLNFPDYTGNVSNSTSNYAAPNAVSVYFDNLQAKDSATTTYTMAYNVHLYGMYLGRDVNLWASGTEYVNFNADDTFMRVSSHTGGGIDLVGEMGMLVRYVMIRPNSSDNHRFFADGIIMSKNTDLDITDGTPGTYDATADPSGWPDLSGNARIGGELPYYNYEGYIDGITLKYRSIKDGTVNTTATIDAGTSGSQTIMQMNIPMAFSLRWKNLFIDQGGGGVELDTGPSLTLNASLWTLKATLRDIY